MNTVEGFFVQAEKHPEKIAIVFFDGKSDAFSSQKVTTFKEMLVLVSKSQRLIKEKGLGQEDFVLLFEEPSAKLYAFIIAALSLGVKLLVVEPWLPLSHINELINKIKPKGFLSKGLAKIVAYRAKTIRDIELKFSTKDIDLYKENESIEIKPMKEEDLAFLSFTSGTSGISKGVMRSHGLLKRQTDILKKYLHYDEYNRYDLTVFTNLVMCNLSLGKGSIIVPSNWDSEILTKIDQIPQKFKPDTIACGPGFLEKFMNHSRATSLQSFHLGGALGDVRLYERALNHWPEAQLHHVYGSTEAEPVALSELRVAVEESKSANYFQVLYLGKKIPEIELSLEETLWVAGPHVSPFYFDNELENLKNKRQDIEGRVWHNMGDRVSEKNGSLWYGGRNFQSNEDFKLEHEVYNRLQDSRSFIHPEKNKKILIGEAINGEVLKDLNIDQVISGKIFRDIRHRARIDRNKSLRKVKKKIKR
jgi:olefin beta-lactone synthetase